ncbi:MAG: hypothetical protein M1812_001752 [Candelaria pacifica]|nr:MAG: hypothetical protein M1812_001752 [Candelaria pacifica]
MAPTVSKYPLTFNDKTQTPYDDPSHSLSPGQYTPPTPGLTRLRSESSHSTIESGSPVTPGQTHSALEQYTLSSRAHGFSYGKNLVSHGQPNITNTSIGPDDREHLEPHTKSDPLDCIQYKPQPPRLNIRTSKFPASPEMVAPECDAAQLKKKNKFPCPEWRNGCTDLFTTSGHAARHGKKHSGEKNVLCPVCNKAFTRKDNMKQHQRTHESGRGSSSKAKLKDEPRLKKTRQKQQVESRQRQRTSSISSMPSSLPATEQHFDSIPASPSGPSFRYPSPPTRDALNDLPLREARASQISPTSGAHPECETSSTICYQSSPLYTQPLSAGLDVLAIAASGISYI